MNWKFWLVVLVIVVVAFAARRVQLSRKLRKQLNECTTHKEAELIACNAYMQGFLDIMAEASAKEKKLFAEFLRAREDQFQKDLDKAAGSEEELFSLLRDGRYSEHIDPHFRSRAEMMIREKLRPFTESRILTTTSFEGLMELNGCRRYLKNLFMGGGFNRIDEDLENLFSQKVKQLACKEAIASRYSRDLCFEVKTGDKFIDALIAMKKETIVLASQDPPFDLGELYRGVDFALRKAWERV